MPRFVFDALRLGVDRLFLEGLPVRFLLLPFNERERDLDDKDRDRDDRDCERDLDLDWERDRRERLDLENDMLGPDLDSLRFFRD